MEIIGVVFMLKKSFRLKKAKDFQKIFKEGKLIKDDFLLLRFVANNRKESRIGIMVSQKVSKKAVLRNKIKRRIRAIIFNNLLKIKKGFDILIIVLPGFEEKNFAQINELIKRVLLKAGLYD